MRKNKLIFAAAAVLILVFSVVAENMESSQAAFRYHQHLEQPSAQDLGPCSVCGGEAALCTHLPIIRIETGGQKVPGKSILNERGITIGYETGDHGEEEIVVQVSTVDKDGVYHHGDDTPTGTYTAMFRIRGNSSRSFPKSSYRIRLANTEDTALDVEAPLLGMAASEEWALHGPFLDKTLLRNYMWMNISGQIMGYAPNVRFCEVILDGEYRGVYVLMETIRMSKSRVNLTKYEIGDPVSSYMVRIENESSFDGEKVIDNYAHYTYRMEDGRGMEVLYPGRSKLSPQLLTYIAEDLSEAERRLYVPDLEADDSYTDFLDINSFVDYYILQEFLMVNDSFSASTYFYKDARGKVAIGPVWDYNNILDNFFLDMPEYEFILSQRGWYGQLMKSEDFVRRVISRWHELRRDVLSEERLMQYVEETIAWLGDAVERNYEVWGYSFDPSLLTTEQFRKGDSDKGQTARSMNPENFEQAVEWMVDTMETRGEWIDRHIETLLQYCQPSRNANSELE